MEFLLFALSLDGSKAPQLLEMRLPLTDSLLEDSLATSLLYFSLVVKDRTVALGRVAITVECRIATRILVILLSTESIQDELLLTMPSDASLCTSTLFGALLGKVLIRMTVVGVARVRLQSRDWCDDEHCLDESCDMRLREMP
jgi:hypothetical protein